MKIELSLFVILIFAFGCDSNIKTSEKYGQDDKEKIKVYLLGSFHFAQTDSTYNILDKQHQQSIEELSELIARQIPDKIFVERQPEYEFQNKIDSLYEEYLMNNQRLKYKNELYQIGFRVASKLGHKKVYQCDHPGMYGSYFGEAYDYAKNNNQLKLLDGNIGNTILRRDDNVNQDSLMKELSLLNYIKWLNEEESLQTSHQWYTVNCIQVGSSDYYNYNDELTLLGAEVTADWYRRNILIYTKMINQMNYTENSIFLLIGSDHIPILRELFNTNPYFEVIPTSKWLN